MTQRPPIENGPRYRFPSKSPEIDTLLHLHISTSPHMAPVVLRFSVGLFPGYPSLTAPPPLTSLPRSSPDSVPFPSAPYRPPTLRDTSGNRTNANPSPPPPPRTQNPSYPLHPPTLTSPTSTSTRKPRSLSLSAQTSTCSSMTR